MAELKEHDDFRALCGAVGFLVLNWGIAEQQIDNWVNVAFINCGGKKLRKNGNIPRFFAQKAAFLSECFKKLPELKPFKHEATKLIARLRAVSTLRNDLVHGGLVSMEHLDGAYKFRKVNAEEENHSVGYFNFGPAEFSSCQTELGNLISDQIAFSQRLANALLSPTK